MANWRKDLENLDVMQFARSIERHCQEAVKWERLKSEWILERKNAQEHTKCEVA